MHNGVTPAEPEPLTDAQLIDVLRGTDPFWLTLDAPSMKRLELAIMLSPTIEICEALLRGEKVPLSKLDEYQVRRYGIRAAS